MQDIGAVHEQASCGPDGGNLFVGERAEFEVQRSERDVLAALEGNDPGGPVVLGDVGEEDERRQLLVVAVVAWDHQAMAAVVAV